MKIRFRFCFFGFNSLFCAASAIGVLHLLHIIASMWMENRTARPVFIECSIRTHHKGKRAFSNRNHFDVFFNPLITYAMQFEKFNWVPRCIDSIFFFTRISINLMHSHSMAVLWPCYMSNIVMIIMNAIGVVLHCSYLGVWMYQDVCISFIL